MKGYLVWYNGDRDDSDFIYTEYFDDAKLFLDEGKAWNYCEKVNKEEIERRKKNKEFVSRYNYYLISDFEVIE